MTIYDAPTCADDARRVWGEFGCMAPASKSELGEAAARLQIVRERLVFDLRSCCRNRNRSLPKAPLVLIFVGQDRSDHYKLGRGIVDRQPPTSPHFSRRTPPFRAPLGRKSELPTSIGHAAAVNLGAVQR